MNKAINPQRKLSYDIIRIVALLSIVLVHVSAYMVLSYRDTTTAEFIIGNIFNGICRGGIPLFVMLSGALLLNEDKTFNTKSFYKKSLLWMVCLLAGWLLAYSLFYGIVLPLSTGSTPSIERIVNYILAFKGTDYPHLWYMFMVIGLYLMIPVLRLFVKRENSKYIFWMVVGCFTVKFLAEGLDIFVADNAVVSVSDFMGKFHLEPLTGYMGYLLTGWYLANNSISKRFRVIAYIVGFGAMFAAIPIVQFTISDIPSIRAYMYGDAVPPFLYGTVIFILISSICNGKITQSTIVKKISDYCFGIYIIHVVYLEIFTKLIFPYSSSKCGPFVYILHCYFTVLAVSCVTVAVIAKIPYLKKIFYLKK